MCRNTGCSEVIALLRTRVFEWTARALAAEGRKKVALFGAGQHTRPIVRQPWVRFGMEVVLIYDDAPSKDALSGVPIQTPAQWLHEQIHSSQPNAFDVLVVSSAVYEDKLGRRAVDVLGSTLEELNVPIVLPYRGTPTAYDEISVLRRLQDEGIVTEDEAQWLIANRDERHDATLPMIHSDRTEFHLRRYELAAEFLRDLEHRSVADIACGVGYGARLLTNQGNAMRYTGVDINPQAIAYANRRHAVNDHVQFLERTGDDTSIETNSIDMVTSFETIEHIGGTESLLREFARILRPGGSLIISTPNALGPTPYHVHDFDFPAFEAILSNWFNIKMWFGQLPVDEVFDPELPPGIFPLDLPTARAGETDRFGRRPHVLIAVCDALAVTAVDGSECQVDTRHGPLRLKCPTKLARWRAETFLTKEPETLAWIDEFEKDDVFWDIGANIGVYTLYAAAARRAQRILAFEPSPWNAALLAEHIRINGFSHTVATYPIALTDTTSPGTLFMRDTSAASAGSSFADPVGEFGERFDPTFEQAALGVRVDDLVAWGAPAPNRIKIDVDGAEERVLAGATDTLARPSLRSISIELDASRTDLVDRVTQTFARAGLELTAQLHDPAFASGKNASIYNFHFCRVALSP